MTSYRGTINPVDGKFRIREVPHIPPVDRRNVSVGRLADCITRADLYRICLAIGVAAPVSTPVAREVAVETLTNTHTHFDASTLSDEAVQRVYDLSLMTRQQLADVIQRFFELHDLIDA